MSKQVFSPDFELWVVDFYKAKLDNCKKDGKEFKLNLIAFRNLCRTQKCPYTGIALTMPRQGKPLSSDLTIDRIDNSKGYVKGNVMAISRCANNFKSIFENKTYPMDMLTAEKALGKMRKVINKKEGEKCAK